MLPLGDDNRDRERWPVLTFALVAVNVLVFLYEWQLAAASPYQLEAFLTSWGVVPREYGLGMDLPPQIEAPYFTTLLTSMFLHGGVAHLLGNMLYLWIFGDNVEDRLGRPLYLVFYLATGMCGSLAQILVDPSSKIPSVGASGAISGILGAYLIMYPHKPVRVLLFYFVTTVPAFVVIGMWALTQFVSGFGSLSRSVTSGGVAYMAHVGGFVAGIVLALLFRRLWRAPQRRNVWGE